MENQRILLYCVMGFLLLLIWQNWQLDYGPRPEQQAGSSTTAPADSSAANNGTGEFSDIVPSGVTADSQVPQTAADTAEKIQVSTDLFDVELSTRGGSVTGVWLNDYAISIDQPDSKFVLMSDEPDKFFVYQAGLQSTGLELPNHHSIYSAETSSYQLADGIDELKIPLVWTGENGLKVTKTLTFARDSYLINTHYLVENTSDTALAFNQYRQLQRKPITKGERARFMNNYIGGVVSTPEDVYQKLDFGDMEDSDLLEEVDGGWAAILQHYFVGAIVPEADASNTFYTKALKSPERYILGMYSTTVNAEPKSTQELNSELYIGPKIQDRLVKHSEKLNLVVDYGWLTILANPIFWLLKHIHNFIGNWGWSVIVLTIIIKACFYKLSETSYKSMARMRKLQPKLLELKEKYNGDQQMIGKKTMEMYKKEKANPLGGCLPMLVQIPVFIALYWVILESVELRQAPWALWIKDMSSPDPYFVLPVVMGATQFLQQKLSPMVSGDPVRDRIFMFLPLFFTVFFAFFPAGLVLYWIVSNIVNIAQQYYITRYVVEREPTKK